MDEASIKKALGEVLASELKVMNEQLSVLPEMQRGIRDLKHGQERMQVDIDVLKLTVTNHSEQLREIRTDVAELKTDVAVLKTDVAELKTDVAELKCDVAVLKEDVSCLKVSMSNVETVVDRHEQEIGTLKRKAG